ncbi:MAG: hypothetical protein R3A48_23210 [Polyangiales bacterium]
MIPKSVVRHGGLAHFPLDSGWKPCIYSDQWPVNQVTPEQLRDGALRPRRSELGAALQSTLCLWLLRSYILGGDDEASVSVALNDGHGWCQCDACVLSQTRSATRRPTNVVNFTTVGGYPVLNDSAIDPVADRLEASQVGNPPPELVRVEEITTDRVRSFMRLAPSVRQVSANQIAWQGMMPHAFMAIQSLNARAAVDYANILAYAVDPDGGAVWRGAAGDRRWRTRFAIPPLTEFVITTHAYSSARGAPLFAAPIDVRPLDEEVDFEGGYFGPEAWVEPLGEPLQVEDHLPRLHPRLLVFVTGSSDHSEYGREPLGQSSVAMLQSRHPQWFNWLRWAMIADHLGIYEYAYGAGFVAPRQYTRRVYRQMRLGVRSRARAFYAECYPNWGTGALMMFEMAQLAFWRPVPRPDEVRPGLPVVSGGLDYPEVAAMRSRWCQRMYGSAASQMVTFYDLLEDRWCAMTDVLERSRGDKEVPFLGSRAIQMEAVDPSAEAVPGATLDRLRDMLRRAAALVSSEELPRRRLELVSRSFAVIAAMAEVSRAARVVVAGLRTLRGASARVVGSSATQFFPSGALTPREFNDPAFGAARDALSELNSRVVGIELFREQVRRPVHDAMRAAGMVRIGSEGQLLAPVASQDEVLPYEQLLFARSSVNQYLSWWNPVVLNTSDARPDSYVNGIQGILYDLKRLVEAVAASMIEGGIRWDGAAMDDRSPFDDVVFAWSDVTLMVDGRSVPVRRYSGQNTDRGTGVPYVQMG